MALYGLSHLLYSGGQSLWGHTPVRPICDTTSAQHRIPVVPSDTRVFRADISADTPRDLITFTEQCSELQTSDGDAASAVCKNQQPRSVRHFLRDARSDKLAFTEVYFFDTHLPQTLRTKSGKAYRYQTVRIYFMLRETLSENAFDMYGDAADTTRFVRGGRMHLVFDVVNSATIQPKESGRRRSLQHERDQRAYTNFYDDVVQIYGVMFAPLDQNIIIRLDRRFPHSKHAPEAMDLAFTSVLGTQNGRRSAIQHAVVSHVYKTPRQLAERHPADMHSMLYFERYFHHIVNA